MEKAWGISQCTTFHLGLYIWKQRTKQIRVFIWIEDFFWIIYSAGQLQNTKADTVNSQTEINLFLLYNPSKKYIFLLAWPRPEQGWCHTVHQLLSSSAHPWQHLAGAEPDLSLFCSMWHTRAKEPEKFSGPACNTFILLVNKHLWHGREAQSPIIQHHLDILNTLFKIIILFYFAFLETPCIPLYCQN